MNSSGKTGELDNMKFTFGVCTTLGNEKRIRDIIHSIEKNNIPVSDCEIIVVGNVIKPCFTRLDVRILPFDESVKDGWITRKKNIITENARFENIVYMHDYIVLEDGWYKSMCEYGGNWDLLMTRIINHDGSRYRDWALCGSSVHNPFIEEGTMKALLPYNEKRLSKWMYFSGAYWVAKKDFMNNYPLDENLCWGQGEDVEWSYRVKESTEFFLNSDAAVKVNKNGKAAALTESSQKYLDEIYDLITDSGARPLTSMKNNLCREDYFND